MCQLKQQQHRREWHLPQRHRLDGPPEQRPPDSAPRRGARESPTRLAVGSQHAGHAHQRIQLRRRHRQPQRAARRGGRAAER